MSTTATVLYESSTTHSIYNNDSPITSSSIVIVHPRSKHRQQGRRPPPVIMQSDQENSLAERYKSVNSTSDTGRPIGCMDDGTGATGATGACGSTDDDEVEPFRTFLAKSPMMSVRRVGQDLVSTKPSNFKSGRTSRYGVLDRTTSAPITGNTTNHQTLNGKNNRRRSIFDAFWESSSLKPKERFHMPRRHTMDVSSPQRTLLSCQFLSLSLRSEEEFAAASMDVNFLSSVPAPLERLMSRSSGVYPLFEPKSILKKKEQHNDGSVESSVVRLKQTLTKLSSTSDGSSSNYTAEDNATETTCASSASTFKTVHFDPRVVVTEVHDPVPRCWYSEQELQKFQCNTVKLAKAYLQMHPELAPIYSKPFYDPIIKKMRRKPLFALPGLSEVDFSPNDLLVKRILVVDPNDKFQSLLCRSLQIVFPAAEMVRTHSGLEALDMLKRGDFDIVICQEHLSSRNNSCGPEIDTSSALFAKYQLEEEKKWQRTLLISISPHIGEQVEPRSIVGKGATDFVWGLPPPTMDLELQRTLVVALEKKRAQ
jgi:CheY-like chemotaxis protein